MYHDRSVATEPLHAHKTNPTHTRSKTWATPFYSDSTCQCQLSGFWCADVNSSFFCFGRSFAENIRLRANAFLHCCINSFWKFVFVGDSGATFKKRGKIVWLSCRGNDIHYNTQFDMWWCCHDDDTSYESLLSLTRHQFPHSLALLSLAFVYVFGISILMCITYYSVVVGSM